MAAPVQTTTLSSPSYKVPAGMLQASKALTLKREIDTRCSVKAEEILRLAERYPLEPSGYDFHARPGQVIDLTNKDLFSVNLARLMPDYAQFVHHMYIPMEALGVVKQQYYAAVKAADFLNIPEAVEFFSRKAVLEIEQQYVSYAKELGQIAAADRGFMMAETNPVSSNEVYARRLFDFLKALDIEPTPVPLRSITDKIKSPILLWEMQRRSLETIKTHMHFQAYLADWDEVWHSSCQHNKYDEKVEPGFKPPGFWMRLFIERYFEARLDSITARLATSNLALLLCTGHLIATLKLNVSRISTSELFKLFTLCPYIKNLTLLRFSSADIQALSALSGLQSLSLITADEPVYDSVETLPDAIEQLTIADCCLKDGEFLALFNPNGSLRSLSFIDCPFLTDAGLREIFRRCAHLKELTLRNCPKVSGAGLATLSVHLESLHLEDMHLDPENLQFLLKTHTFLRILRLIHLVNMKGAALQPLWENPPLRLEELQLTGAPQLIPSKIKTLLRKLSHLKVLAIQENEWLNDIFIREFNEDIRPLLANLRSVDFSRCSRLSK